MIFGLPEKEFLAKGHNACAGCGQLLAIRLALKACDKDTILVQATGCGEVTTTPYPLTAYKLPYIHNAFENAASTASGVKAALNILNKKTKVLVLAGDGSTFDIGFGALSGMFERGEDITYICFDTEAYSNTGIQRSGATPTGAWTTTKPEGKQIKPKDIISIAVAHHIPYIATASISNQQDLVRKVKEGLNTKGPSFIHILCPCVPGWKIPESSAINISKIAIETNFWPLLEIKKGKYILNYKPKKQLPIETWLKMQGRFKGISKELIKEIQKNINKRMKTISPFVNEPTLCPPYQKANS